MNLEGEWTGQSSADHRATVLLRQEHEALLDLFRRQRAPLDGPATAREALQESIVALIDLLGRIERDVVFPALPQEYEPLIRALVADRHALDRCLASVEERANDAALANAVAERLENLAREQFAQEEALLFTPLEREHPHLNAELYERLVAERARLAAADRPDTRG